MTLRFVFAALVAASFLYLAPAGAKEASRSPTVWGYVARPDGSIGVYNLDTRTGDLRVVPRNTVPAQPLPVDVSYPENSKVSPLLMLAAHPSGRFLYAFVPFPPRDDFSDHSESADENAHRPTRQVRVYRIVPASGALHLVQTAQVPAPIMQLVPHPGGRFLYGLAREGILCVLQTRPDGTLVAGKQVRIGDAPSVLNHWYSDDEWQIRFAPNGKTLYTVGNTWSTEYRQDSISKEGGYWMLQATGDEQKQWRVSADGDLKKMGDTWKPKIRELATLDEVPESVQDDPGFILAISPSGNTVAMDGDASRMLWVCRTDKYTGQILPPGKPLDLPNLGGGQYRFVTHPRYPFVFVGKEYTPTTQYGVYQWGAEGELKKIGGFAPLIGTKQRGNIFAEPTGRYLIEWGTTSVAIHRTDERGVVTPARQAKSLPGETGGTVLFVAPDAKGKTL